jgi:hypothetical protein
MVRLKEVGMHRRSLVGLFILAGLGAGLDCARPAAPTQPAFTLASDPAEKVLRVQFAATTAPAYVEWTVYGDGRLEKVESYTSDPVRRREVRLTSEQVHALVSRAIDQGLADTNYAALDAKVAAGWAALRPEGQRFTPAIPPPADDAPTSELEIRFASYRGGRSPHVVLLRRKGVEGLARDLPMVPELQEWARLAKALDELVTKEQPK